MRQRGAGLIRSVRTRGLSTSVINAVVGASIFAIPGPLAACVSPYASLAFFAVVGALALINKGG